MNRGYQQTRIMLVNIDFGLLKQQNYFSAEKHRSETVSNESINCNSILQNYATQHSMTDDYPLIQSLLNLNQSQCNQQLKGLFFIINANLYIIQLLLAISSRKHRNFAPYAYIYFKKYRNISEIFHEIFHHQKKRNFYNTIYK